MDMKKEHLMIATFLIICGHSVIGESINFGSWKNQYLGSDICKGETNLCNTQLQQGESKSYNFDVNIREAVKVVHRYSHPAPDFHSSLNKNCDSSKKLFSDFKHLLSKAIDTLKTYNPGNWKTSVTTFRGIRPKDYSFFNALKQNDIWDLTGFTSTSIRPEVGLRFSWGNILLKITNVHGLYIEPYTAVQNEFEVLIKHPLSHEIIEMITDKGMIKTEIDKLVNPGSIPYPQMYLKLRMTMAGRRRKRSANTYSSCDFTSDGVVVLPKSSSFTYRFLDYN